MKNLSMKNLKLKKPIYEKPKIVKKPKNF